MQPLTYSILNCFGSRKDFGVVIGTDKDNTVKVSLCIIHYPLIYQDFSLLFLGIQSLVTFRFCVILRSLPYFQVIKEGSEGPVVVNVKQSELKIASFDRKLFNVLDQHSNTLRANDEVRVLDGPLKV